jgi:ribosome-binding factor A
MPREFARKLRLNAQFQQELALLIRNGLGDPRVAGVTVTAVDVAPDLRNATVRVSLLGTDEQLKQALDGLTHAAGHLRRALGSRLQLRLVPQLRFVADTALREGDRIGALIKAAVADDERHADRKSR